MARRAAHVLRAAFDVGSGATKVTVAVVSPSDGAVVRILYSDQTELLLRHDLQETKATTGRDMLSDACVGRLLERLAFYAAEARGAGGGDDAEDSVGAVQMVGCATAVFRSAENGEEVLERVRSEIEIDVQMVSQELEGRLGFLTAKAVGPADVKAEELIAWDSGGGSFQITNKSGKVGEMVGVGRCWWWSRSVHRCAWLGVWERCCSIDR